ncbi:MAG TPA: hypothetical protein VFK02_21570 [Kofleriaceae bacterium]|nr:hypothetical protein [Kofleriaceae bacterium]
MIAAAVWPSPERGHSSSSPGFILTLPPIVAWLEEVIGELPPSARAAWLELFDGLGYHSEAALPPRSVRAALAPIDAGLGPEVITEWLRLRSELDEITDDGVVRFRRW